jgi:hypothetical protein
MNFKEGIQLKSNVFIIARERGKKVPGLCRDSHNVWVNLGREYLADVISPLAGFTGHVNDYFVRFMALGIGGDSQRVDIATLYPTLDSHYPGQNIFDDTLITVAYLERPVKVTGTAGTGAAAGVWMSDVSAPPTKPVATTVEFDVLFSESDLHLSGSYPAVPLSEIGLMLSNETASRPSNEVYDYGSPPDYINAATRQQVVAYNTFETLIKTSSVSLELHWQIQF